MIIDLIEGSFERFRNGDEQVFDELFNGYSQALYGMVYQIIRRKDAAEDIVIETFLKLWENRGRMNDPRHIQNFLFVTARHAAIDYQRNTRKLRVNMSGSMDDIGAIKDKDRVPLYEELNYGLILKRIEREVEALPRRRRQVFRLHWMEGKSVDEIAVAMDISPSTVYNQLGMASKTIRNNLGDMWLEI